MHQQPHNRLTKIQKNERIVASTMMRDLDRQRRGNEQETQTSLERNRRKAVEHLLTYLDASDEERTLREYQTPAMHALYRSLESGKTAGYIEIPTGGGKTVIASEVIEVLGLNTIVVSPTGVILDKTKQTIEKYAPSAQVTTFDGRSKQLTGNVITTTLPSLETLAEIPAVAEGTELLIVDEVDFGTLSGQRHNLWRKFPNALLLGFTGTADFSQLDALQVEGYITQHERWTRMFTHRIHGMSREEAQQAGALTPLDIHILKTNAVVGEVHVTEGDYRQNELDTLLNTEARNLQIIALLAGVDSLPPTVRLTPEKRAELKELHEQIKGKRTFVFGLSVNHIEALAKRLKEKGVNAATLHGKHSASQRDSLLEAHAAGTQPIILGVDLMGRGLDSPATEVGIFGRPRKRDVPLIQEIGRIVRLSEETGKTRALAIQLVDTFTDLENAPILIPEVIDPNYILQGHRKLLDKQGGATGSTRSRRQEATITISGMDFESVTELVHQVQVRRALESVSTLSALNNTIDNAITTIRKDTDPETESVVTFYKKLAAMFPLKLASRIQRLALEGAKSDKPDVKAQGEKTFVLLNLKTIIRAVERHFSANQAGNEELLHTAISRILQEIGNVNPDQQISLQIFNLLKVNEITDVAAEEETIPPQWIKARNAEEIVTRIDEEIVQRATLSSEGLDGREMTVLALELAEDTGYNPKDLATVIVERHNHFFGVPDHGNESDPLYKQTREEAIEAVLVGLTQHTIEKFIFSIRNDITQAKSLHGANFSEAHLAQIAEKLARRTGYEPDALQRVIASLNERQVTNYDEDMELVATIRYENDYFGREEAILRMRNGYHPDYPEGATRKQVSDVFGLSSQRIAQIEDEAKIKLRHPCRRGFEELYEYYQES